MFNPDKPIETSDDDFLGRALFSKAYAEAILKYKDPNSIVTAIYGAWGSGKSSVINMVLEYIDKYTKGFNKEEKPIIVKFNPWNYSDQNQILSQFFNNLSAALQRKDYGTDAIKVGEKLEVYAVLLSPLTFIPHPAAILAGTIGSKLMKVFGTSTKKWGELKSNDLNSIRKELDRLLRKQKRKIIIVIDDIDRLNAVETRQIFQLVKMLGDFPNTIYLLAFEKSVVARALEKEQEGYGEKYLEKIVQIPFELPLISKLEVEQLLFNSLDELLKDTPKGKWDKTYWGNILHSGFKYFFNNIRHVNRYINSLRFSFEMAKDEVNSVDLFAIIGLQVFEPELYLEIRENKDLFTGVFDSYGNRERQVAEAEEQCEEIIKKSLVLSEAQVKDFLSELFPKINSIYNNIGYGTDWLVIWRQQRRVASPDVFDIYFRLSIPKDEISQKEMESLLSLSEDITSFSSELLKLNDEGRIIRFLERMQDYTKEFIPEENIKNIITVLMDIGDLFPEGVGGFTHIDTPMKIMRILHQLTQRYATHEERFEIFKSAIEFTKQSLYTIVQNVGIQGQEHGKNTSSKSKPDPEEKRTVNREQLLELEELACKKIEEWAADGKLNKHSKMLSILYSWQNWYNNGSQKAKEYVEELVKNDEGLIDFVTACMGKSFSQVSNDYVGRIIWNIDLKNVEDFVAIKNIESRIRSIAASGSVEKLTDFQQKALKNFLDKIDGKNNED